MRLPSEVVAVLEDFELPLRFASEVSTNDERIDCADSALVAAEGLEVLPVRVLSRF